MELKDKIVVITGSSKGLGKGLAYAFANKGAKVVVSARHSKELEAVVNNLSALSVVANVSNEQDIITLANAVIEKYGQIDIWINNAGIWQPHAPIEKTDWNRIHEMMEVNLFGTIYGSKAALLQMRKQNSGTIINIISTSALEGRAGSSGYCASKFAVMGFTKSLRAEAKDTLIKVLAIYPGGMQTNFFDEQKPDNLNDYMAFDFVAEKIVANIEQASPEEELIIKRPNA